MLRKIKTLLYLIKNLKFMVITRQMILQIALFAAYVLSVVVSIAIAGLDQIDSLPLVEQTITWFGIGCYCGWRGRNDDIAYRRCDDTLPQRCQTGGSKGCGKVLWYSGHTNQSYHFLDRGQFDSHLNSRVLRDPIFMFAGMSILNLIVAKVTPGNFLSGPITNTIVLALLAIDIIGLMALVITPLIKREINAARRRKEVHEDMLENCIQSLVNMSVTLSPPKGVSPSREDVKHVAVNLEAMAYELARSDHNVGLRFMQAREQQAQKLRA